VGTDNGGLPAPQVKLLAFDTSTETLSVALSAAEGAPLLEYTGEGGAHASASLIPAIERLLQQGGFALQQLDAIAYGRGPGSFTGLRTATAVAQGLGFGAGVPVLPVDTLLAVAQEAHLQAGVEQVVALLDARMGEVYFAAYERVEGRWRSQRGPALGRPEDVVVPEGWAVAGNALEMAGLPLAPGTRRVPALPTARALVALAPMLLADGAPHAAAEALPLYIRDKVAQTTEERAAERARKELRRGASTPESP
jgi:tRNA threonylcarbamoyladenosine biosynthesis protein TsaB